MQILDENDRKTAVWQKIEQYLKNELIALREQNDNPMDAEKTAGLRGEIRQVKKLLGNCKEPPKHNASGANYS